MSPLEESAERLREIEARLCWLEANLPKNLDGWAISQKSKLPFKALGYRATLSWRMAEVGRSALDSLLQKKLVAAILLTRAAVETSAALWFACEKIHDVVHTGDKRTIDDDLMRLLMGSRLNPEMPEAFNVLKFVDRVEKDIKGFRHQYDVLSEYAHPNWAGTALLFWKPDETTAGVVSFGSNIRGNESPLTHASVNLSVALAMFANSYNRLEDLIPAFISLCEANQS